MTSKSLKLECNGVNKIWGQHPRIGKKLVSKITGKFQMFDYEKSRVADPDPASIGSVDPDPESGSGSGSRRAKMTHKNRKNYKSFEI